ncbi:hypothetical protein Tsubulata_028515 [Turnera subulata]|uniref:Oligosaccharyltransferase complex subunit n=1 Tax=Turnera subulata TaxID=218843 RepID=A0A9Q0IW85_9ROSI|nr:hypothetical protein Tsubulata_028515 [Turnera subulata]
MAPKSDAQSQSSAASQSPDSHSASSIDPLFHIIKILPFAVLRPPRLRLKLPSFTLPSPMSVFALLLTYFMVVSGIVYDVIVEPPGNWIHAGPRHRRRPPRRLHARPRQRPVHHRRPLLRVHVRARRHRDRAHGSGAGQEQG